MNSDELRNWATVIGAAVALLVFVANSRSQFRTRKIANLSRFMAAHQSLFSPDGYIAANIAAMNSGTLTRDPSDAAMEARFHLMLIEIERLAVLANNDAVPWHTQVYLFGWYARHLRNVVSVKERESMFWELAVGYLDDLEKQTAKYERLGPAAREKYWH